MKQLLNKENLRKLLATEIHPLQWLDKMSWETFGAAAFVALAAFGLWPVIVLLPTLFHCSFDRMVDWNMTLLDRWLFPLVAWVSVAVYALSLTKALREKRRLGATFAQNPTFALFLALVVWMTANIWMTNGVTYSLLNGAGLKHESFFLHLEYYLCFLPLGLFLRDSRLKLWLLRGLTVVSAILASCAPYLHDHLLASPYYYDWFPSYSAIFTTWNYYGYFLVISIGLSAGLFVADKSRRWRLLYAFSIIVNTAVLSYNNSFGSWIGSFCACLFLVTARRVMDGKFTRRPLIALGLFTLTLCLTGLLNGTLAPNVFGLFSDVHLIATQPDSPEAALAGTYRWYIWKNCFSFIRQHPIVGIGFEGVHVRNLQIVGNPRPHNEFIQYALFYGIPGGLLYIAACAGVITRAVRLRKRLDSLTLAALTSAFGYWTGSFFGLTVYNTAPYFFIMLGLGYVWTGTESPNVPETPTPDKSETESA